MKLFWVLVWTLFVYFFGAVTHEHDMSINFNRTGDAQAWFFDIKK